jgi:membrane-associated protease RseP (regulator of RpoE activity)
MLPGMGASRGGFAMAAGLSAHGSQGYLGVNFRDIGEDQVGALKLKEARGAEVVQVDHDAPAGKAGLREHDVVLQMNGQVVEGQEQLRRLLRETPPGRNVTLLISRDGQQITVTAQLANRAEVERQWAKQMGLHEAPRDDASNGGASAPAGPSGPGGGPGAGGPGGGPGGGSGPRGGLGFFRGGGPPPGSMGHGEHGFLATMIGAPYTGAAVEPLGPQLGEFFGVQSGAGLLVRSVDPNSPAATAGLKAGDVVIKANQVTMSSVGEWSKTLHESKGRPLPVLLVRDKKEQTVTLTPDPKRKSGMQWPGFGPGFANVSPEPDSLLAQSRPMPDGGLSELFDEMRRSGDLSVSSPEMDRRVNALRQQLEEMESERLDLLQ